ncbi:MAG: hypothetical protein KY428_01400, partial [Bacteroidetes bacterium]|nr:hypothetical protein [Bacteroidota bacterium]
IYWFSCKAKISAKGSVIGTSAIGKRRKPLGFTEYHEAKRRICFYPTACTSKYRIQRLCSHYLSKQFQYSHYQHQGGY